MALRYDTRNLHGLGGRSEELQIVMDKIEADVLASELDITPSATIYVDANRTDEYTADGTVNKPFKTIAAALSSIAESSFTTIAVWLAPKSTYTITSDATLSIPVVIYGNGSTITISSGVTLTITNNYVASDLEVVGGSVVYAGSSASKRFIPLNGSDTGVAISLSLGTLDTKSRNQIGGTVAVSGGTYVPTETVFTSVITQTGGAITMQNCNMNTNSSTGLVNSTGGSFLAENTIFSNAHVTASPVIIDNGVATNEFLNCAFLSPNATSSVDPVSFTGSTSYAIWGHGNIHAWGESSLPSSMPATYLILPTATGTPVNAQTGTTYTLLPNDNGKVVTCTNASAITVTVTAGYFISGHRVKIQQGGAGQVTLVGSGVTITTCKTLKTLSQYAEIELVFTSPTTAYVTGEMAES